MFVWYISQSHVATLNFIFILAESMLSNWWLLDWDLRHLYKVLFLLLSNSLESVFSAEYCIDERFNVTCPEGHVIIFNSAWYGQKKQGRCTPKDLGHLGCGQDASDIMDTKCLGRK